MELKVRGMILAVVSTWMSARAGKKKLAGYRENSVGIEALNEPVAATRGMPALNDRAGTRGMTIARIAPMLHASVGIFMPEGD